MSIRIIHLSDLHIGKWLELPQKRTEEDNLEKWINHICKSYKNDPKPIILITGDLINDGDPKQYDEVKSNLQPLFDARFVVWPIPGNHDYGRLGNHAEKKCFKYFKKAFFGRDNPYYPHENVVYPQTKRLNGHWFIGLNSMKGELGYLDKWLADGELGEKQMNNTIGLLENLNKRTLSEKKKEKVILFLHHHPFLFPHEGFLDDAKEVLCHYLKDGEELMTKISGLVDILLFGHEHLHMNFAGTPLCKRHKIPHILSCGKSTVESRELSPNRRDMKKEPKPSGPEGLLAWDINIDNEGHVDISSLVI